MPPVDVIGIDHIYSRYLIWIARRPFYDRLMVNALGFRKNTFMLNGAAHIQYFNRHFGYVLRPATRASKHDASGPGLHHFCFRVDSPADVSALAAELRSLGIDADAKRYPEYAPDYWATFLTDPDGICLEVTNYRQERRARHNQWPIP